MREGRLAKGPDRRGCEKVRTDRGRRRPGAAADPARACTTATKEGGSAVPRAHAPAIAAHQRSQPHARGAAAAPLIDPRGLQGVIIVGRRRGARRRRLLHAAPAPGRVKHRPRTGLPGAARARNRAPTGAECRPDTAAHHGGLMRRGTAHDAEPAGVRSGAGLDILPVER
eukprot:scaffold11628_cov95-Isochrysis_galbana.AAC.2